MARQLREFPPTYGFGLGRSRAWRSIRDSGFRTEARALERDEHRSLAALRMQIVAHTLFNLLHTIRGHIEWDPKGAQSMVVQLADLLRGC